MAFYVLFNLMWKNKWVLWGKIFYIVSYGKTPHLTQISKPHLSTSLSASGAWYFKKHMPCPIPINTWHFRGCLLIFGSHLKSSGSICVATLNILPAYSYILFINYKEGAKDTKGTVIDRKQLHDQKKKKTNNSTQDTT